MMLGLMLAAVIACDHSTMLTSIPPMYRCWTASGETVFCLTTDLNCQGVKLERPRRARRRK